MAAEVYADRVVVVERSREEHSMQFGKRDVQDSRADAHRARWIGAEQEITFTNETTADPASGAHLTFPDAPGAPFSPLGFGDGRSHCGRPLFVGPRRMVFACTGGVDPVVPGFGVGLRVLSY